MLNVKYLSQKVLLVDYGEAFDFEKLPKPNDIGLPVMYRAPETIFDSRMDPSSEAWSLACVLAEIRAGDPLFASIMSGKDEIVQQMVQMRGKLPDPWWGAFQITHAARA